MRMLPKVVGGELAGRCVVQVSASQAHTACITNDGKVYSWGSGKFGKLGLGDEDMRTLPTVVSGELAGRCVVQVSAGEFHTACVTDEGLVYSWGGNQYGKLGLGDEDMRMLPTVVGGELAGRCVVQVSASQAHTACITNDDKVY